MLPICFNVCETNSETFIVVSELKMLYVCFASNDTTLPSCVAVCPEVNIRNSIVTGETSRPHTSLKI